MNYSWKVTEGGELVVSLGSKPLWSFTEEGARNFCEDIDKLQRFADTGTLEEVENLEEKAWREDGAAPVSSGEPEKPNKPKCERCQDTQRVYYAPGHSYPCPYCGKKPKGNSVDAVVYDEYSDTPKRRINFFFIHALGAQVKALTQDVATHELRLQKLEDMTEARTAVNGAAFALLNQKLLEMRGKITGLRTAMETLVRHGKVVEEHQPPCPECGNKLKPNPNWANTYDCRACNKLWKRIADGKTAWKLVDADMRIAKEPTDADD